MFPGYTVLLIVLAPLTPTSYLQQLEPFLLGKLPNSHSLILRILLFRANLTYPKHLANMRPPIIRPHSRSSSVETPAPSISTKKPTIGQDYGQKGPLTTISLSCECFGTSCCSVIFFEVFLRIATSMLYSKGFFQVLLWVCL